ncbi:O-antigen ligase family protein [Gelidibacter salicanalis]|uniref:O-antigen ligase family protein n=1 Tax=Gelidibacter salicanalis TaxID=291193 RepID=A0A934KSE6_9FLAO|nr:O-antigen ligase family protein [Gelidibacter salicanalis]MBJ7882714.1 O-antigen ligase family protein [Gelidibacter salicanalis]
MKILKYIIFALVILNLPSIALSIYGGALGSVLSYATIVLLAIYYFLEKKSAPNWWLLIIALLFYSISGLQYSGDTATFLMEFIKYIVFIICGYELSKHITITELYVFLLIGALSIGVESIFFPTRFGRYSGFYINPNVAGFICITGFALTYGLKRSSLKYIGQFVFTLTGLLTFSRTFIVIWLFINLISLKISIKNLRILGSGVLILGTLFFIDELIGLNNPRFNQLKSIVNNEDVSNQEITSDSRADTWALFYDQIYDSPLIGNGYGTFSGKGNMNLGVHNTYLRIIGEAGIIPFIVFVIYIMYLLYMSFIYFHRAPNLIMQIIALSLFLMANHNFFGFYYVTFAAMWVQYQIYKLKTEDKLKEIV